MCRVATDFEAEGLLEGAGDERARRARLELLQSLEQEGFSLEELRRATAEDRLVLLPLERVLEGEGPRYTPEEVAERAGLDVRFLSDARRALGAPRAEPGERILAEEDLELAQGSGDDGPLLRAGLAAGDAITRAGDWYGHPVNLASRLTASARPGSVVTAREVREAAGEGFAWSFVGSRRFKGVRGEVGVYRVRPRSDGRPD